MVFTESTRDYEELPGTILTNSLAREFEERNGSWYEPNMAQHADGGKWGLGKVVKERRDKASITPIEVLMKLHKTPVASRPVGRASNSQMKTYEQLVAGILTIVEDINKVWEKEFLEGMKIDEGVEILGYAVVALYPSLKLEFMVREIDRAMVLRIETKEGKEKEQAIALCNVTMSLKIFMLEHQFCSTMGTKGEKTVWR